MDWMTASFVALMSSGITAVITTRPKVILAMARVEAMLRDGMWSQIVVLQKEVKECREDRGHLNTRVRELEYIVSQQFNTVETVGAFFHHIPTPAWMKDPAGRMYMVNRHYEDTFGISHLKCQGRTDDDIWPADVSNEFVSSDNLVLSRGRGLEFEEMFPDRPFEPVSPENPMTKWLVWRFPIVVDGKLFGIGGVAHRMEIAG